MIDLIADRPLLIQIFDWLKLLGHCRDSRDFSAKFINRSPGYVVACKAMGFSPSTEVFRTARNNLLDLASQEASSLRRQLLTELVDRINAHLLGKPEGVAR